MLNAFSAFVMESYYSAREMAEINFVHGVPMDFSAVRRLCAEHCP
jgi:hypothetical protein